MTIFRKISFTIFVIFSLLLISVVALWQVERPTKFYNSYEEMLQKKALQSGWIPAWTPESARNIHESHDIDSNEVRLTFTFSKIDRFPPLACHPIKKENAVFLRKKNFDLFSSHARNMENDIAKNPNLRFFRCDQSGDSYMAINGQKNIVHFWQLGH